MTLLPPTEAELRDAIARHMLANAPFGLKPGAKSSVDLLNSMIEFQPTKTTLRFNIWRQRYSPCATGFIRLRKLGHEVTLSHLYHRDSAWESDFGAVWAPFSAVTSDELPSYFMRHTDYRNPTFRVSVKARSAWLEEFTALLGEHGEFVTYMIERGSSAGEIVPILAYSFGPKVLTAIAIVLWRFEARPQDVIGVLNEARKKAPAVDAIVDDYTNDDEGDAFRAFTRRVPDEQAVEAIAKSLQPDFVKQHLGCDRGERTFDVFCENLARQFACHGMTLSPITGSRIGSCK